jgi:hypothetical protein
MDSKRIDAAAVADPLHRLFDNPVAVGLREA